MQGIVNLFSNPAWCRSLSEMHKTQSDDQAILEAGYDIKHSSKHWLLWKCTILCRYDCVQLICLRIDFKEDLDDALSPEEG